MQNKKITMFQMGIIFTVSLIIFLLFSFIVQLFDPFGDFYISGAVGEVVPILLPAVIGLLIMRKSLKLNLRLNGFNPIDGILVFFIMIFAMPLTMALNAFNMWLVKIIFGFNIPVEIPIPETGPELLISILVIGLAAAVCEEVLFRGVLLTSFEKLGKAGMFLVGSVLFAAFHFSIEQFLGVFALSILITYVVYRTNSLYTGIIAHLTNNAAAMVITFFANKVPEELLSGGAEVEIPVVIQAVVIGIVVLLFTGAAAVFIYALHRRTRNIRIVPDMDEQFGAKDVLTFIPAVIIMAGMYIFTILVYILGPAVGF